MEKLPISVVIPTMNRAKDLEETLESYMTAQGVPMQIVVVDQSEEKEIQDKNRAVLEKYKAMVECLYLYQREASSTKARNIGEKQCKYELVCYSDDDITVKKDTMINVYKLMNNTDISMIAGLNENSVKGNSKLGYLFARKSFIKRKIGHVTKSMFGRFPDGGIKDLVDTEWAMGFFFVIKKSYAAKWGVCFDERLTSYAYAEDLDYSYLYYKNSKKESKRCVMSPEVSVYHRASNEWRIPSKKSTMMLILNREYLSYKHNMGISSQLAIRWANLGEVFLRLAQKSDWRTVIHAQKVCDKHRGSMKKGVLKREWYEE